MVAAIGRGSRRRPLQNFQKSAFSDTRPFYSRSNLSHSPQRWLMAAEAHGEHRLPKILRTRSDGEPRPNPDPGTNQIGLAERLSVRILLLLIAATLLCSCA